MRVVVGCIDLKLWTFKVFSDSTLLCHPTFWLDAMLLPCCILAFVCLIKLNTALDSFDVELYFISLGPDFSADKGFLSKSPYSHFSWQVLDFISAVKGLHRLSSQELGRLIREAENNVIRCTAKNGSHVQQVVVILIKGDRYLFLHVVAIILTIKFFFSYFLSPWNDKILMLQIDVDRFARHLPLHLIAALVNWRPDEALFEYLLSGFRLLHSLCDLAPRPPKIEQVEWLSYFIKLNIKQQLLDFVSIGLYIASVHFCPHS